MARVLQLFNVLGLPTERTMLEVALGVAKRGHTLAFACESVSEHAPPVGWPVHAVPRIGVEPVGSGRTRRRRCVPSRRKSRR